MYKIGIIAIIVLSIGLGILKVISISLENEHLKNEVESTNYAREAEQRINEIDKTHIQKEYKISAEVQKSIDKIKNKNYSNTDEDLLRISNCLLQHYGQNPETFECK